MGIVIHKSTGTKGGRESSLNSSTTPLAADAVFTGLAEDVLQFSSITVSWTSNVASADDGCSMQFSPDGTNWDRPIPVHSHSDTLQVNHGGVHRLAVIARFFRVVYTNGSTIQAHFRLHVICHTDNSLPLISRQLQQLNTSSDCTLVRPVTNIHLDLARREITGQRTFFLAGHNEEIGTSWEDIVPFGGDIPWPTSAAKVSVSSTDTSDSASGTGTRQVEIHGLDATGVDIDEIITMNGTTEVDSVKSYVRVNRLHCENVGTYGGAHQGDITCRVTSGGAKTGNILAQLHGIEGSVDTSPQYGSGEAGGGHYSIPLGKVAYLTVGSVIINTTGTKTADIVLYERDGLLTTSAPFEPRRELWREVEAQGKVIIVLQSHIKIKALTDIWFRAKGSGSGTKISVLMEFYLVDANSSGE